MLIAAMKWLSWTPSMAISNATKSSTMASGTRCWTQLPHIVWTSEDTWDPTSLDSDIFDDPNWYEAEPSPPLPNPMYDEYGEFRGRVLIYQCKLTILEWIPAMVDTVPLIIWLVYVALMKNFHCCQRIQQRQSYKLRVHGVNPQSPLKV
jgi:hypothetical protein